MLAHFSLLNKNIKCALCQPAVPKIQIINIGFLGWLFLKCINSMLSHKISENSLIDQ